MSLITNTTYTLSQVKQKEVDWDGMYYPEVDLFRCGCEGCFKNAAGGFSKPSVFAPLDLGEFCGRAVVAQGNFGSWVVFMPMFSTSIFIDQSCSDTVCHGSYHDVDDFVDWPTDIELGGTLISLLEGFDTFDEAVSAVEEFQSAVLRVYELDSVGLQMLKVSLADGALLSEAVAIAEAVASS